MPRIPGGDSHTHSNPYIRPTRTRACASTDKVAVGTTYKLYRYLEIKI